MNSYQHEPDWLYALRTFHHDYLRANAVEWAAVITVVACMFAALWGLA